MASCCARACSTRSGSSRRPAMPAARSARRWRLSLPRQRRAAPQRRSGRDGRRLSGAVIQRDGDAAAPAGGRRALRCDCRRRCAVCADGGGAGSGAGGWLVPGAYGVRPALARQSLDPCRSTLAADAEGAQSEGQISRELPARSRRRCWPRMSRDWFDLDVASPYMLLVAEVAKHRRIAEATGNGWRGGARSTEDPAVGDSRRDACRLFGARADRSRRDQSALSRAAARLQGDAPAARSW